MKNILKATALSVGLLSIMGLTACQSQAPAYQAKQNMSEKGDRHFKGEHRSHAHAHDRRDGDRRGGDHHGADRRGFEDGRGFGPRDGQRRGPRTEEQKAQFEKMQTERQQQFKALQTACQNNVGKTISVKVGEKTIQGQCQVQFRPIKADLKTPNITPSKTVTPTIAPAPVATTTTS